MTRKTADYQALQAVSTNITKLGDVIRYQCTMEERSAPQCHKVSKENISHARPIVSAMVKMNDATNIPPKQIPHK